MTRIIFILVAVLSAAAQAPRFDAWRIIGPGGGGAMFHPTISPHDSKVVLVSCDMTGAYISLDGGNSWRMFNLGGGVDFFTFDPLDTKTIYAGRSGALFRTTDLARSWNRIFPDTTNPGVLKDDHAEEVVDRQMRALEVDPADSKILYATIIENRAAALYMSSDWGKTWKKDAELPGGGRRLYVDAKSPKADRTIYVVGSNAIAFREKGRWTTGTNPEGGGPVRSFSGAFPPSGGRLVLYATGQTGLHTSTDGGLKWKPIGMISGLFGWGTMEWPKPDVYTVAVAPNRPDVAYVSYTNFRYSLRRKGQQNYLGVARTTDGGRNWTFVWDEPRDGAPNIKDPWITARFGYRWGGQPQSLVVAPGDPNIVFGTDDGRTMRTVNGGETWEGVYSRAVSGRNATTGLDVTTGYGVHFDPFDHQRMFVSYTDIGLFRSEDGGASWISSSKGAPNSWVNTTYWMEFDPTVKDRVWAVMSGTHDLPRPKMWRKNSPANFRGGVVYSEDGGRNWTTHLSNLPSMAATHLLLDPKSPPATRVLYVAGMGTGVFKSQDGGKTWVKKNEGIEVPQPLAWRLVRDGEGTLYLIVARKSEDGSFGNASDGALFRSTDGAEHWEPVPLPTGLNGPVGLAIDPKNPRRLYLAAWGRKGPPGQADLQGGIFLSTDRGGTWRNVLSKDQHIYDVTIDPRDSKILYACGFESSAWRSADQGQTWKRIPGYDFKWGHRVIPDPDHAGKIYITTFGGGVWYGAGVF